MRLCGLPAPFAQVSDAIDDLHEALAKGKFHDDNAPFRHLHHRYLLELVDIRPEFPSLTFCPYLRFNISFATLGVLPMNQQPVLEHGNDLEPAIPCSIEYPL